jgi:hypothetical protein
VPGFIGFAVERTTFWDALVALRDKKTTRDKAVETIANRYVELPNAVNTMEASPITHQRHASRCGHVTAYSTALQHEDG